MKRFCLSLMVGLLFAAGASAAPPAREILFVGNSFTYGNIAPVEKYNNDKVTDANADHQPGLGGVPGIFKKMTDDAGLNFNVTMETAGAQSLEFHLQNKSAIIGQKKWQDIVIQEYSTYPLPDNRGGKAASFFASVEKMKTLVEGSSGAKIYLYATWARPNIVFPEKAAYHGSTLQAMQDDLDSNFEKANSENKLAGIVPVGDAFMRAIADGIGNPAPYSPAGAGRLDLWDVDHYHASKYGSYLSAAMMFGKITGLDPKTVVTGHGSASEGLGISAKDATRLNGVASSLMTTPATQPSEKASSPAAVNTPGERGISLLVGALTSFSIRLN